MKNPQEQLSVESLRASRTLEELRDMSQGCGFGDAELELVDPEALAALLARRRPQLDLESMVRIKRARSDDASDL